jgi:hypothetical protein
MPSCFLVIVSQRTSVNVYDPDIFNCFGQGRQLRVNALCFLHACRNF